MLPTKDLFVYVYVLVEDAIGSGAIAIGSRPGVASGIRCKSAGVVPGFMIRLGDRTDSFAAVGGLAGWLAGWW